MDIAEFTRDAVHTLIMVSLPVLIIALLIGITISLLQALTQIQDATLTFVPKILAIYISLMFFGGYIFTKLENLMNAAFQGIAAGG